MQPNRREDYKRISEFIFAAQKLSSKAAEELFERTFPQGHSLRGQAERLWKRAQRILAEENSSGFADDEDLSVEGLELSRQLGSGGNGIVFSAVQETPRRTIAIKFLKGYLLDPPRRDRFNREIELLTRLNHSDIIKVFGAGVTRRGRAYFTMEYVEGKDIVKHCADANLRLQPRLELFARLCDAVDHGHQRLVLHRDLKPSNILITHDNCLKLIDFGIGRLRHPDPDDEEVARYLLRQPFDDRYSSPELKNNEPAGVETDVYSLGLILYQLLTGVLPTFPNLRKPSEICSAEHAASMGFSAASMRKHFAGDLDLIVMKAIDAVPGRRYQHPNDLAMDLKSFLSRSPIRARDQTFRYRTRLFLLRNPRWIASVCSLFVAVLIVASVAVWQWQRTLDAMNRVRHSEAETRASKEQSDKDKNHAIEVSNAFRDGVELVAKQLEESEAQQKRALSQVYWELAQEYTSDEKLNATLLSRALENTDRRDPKWKRMHDDYNNFVKKGVTAERGSELAVGPSPLSLLKARLQLAQIQLKADGKITDLESLQGALRNSLGLIGADHEAANTLRSSLCESDPNSNAFRNLVPDLNRLCGSKVPPSSTRFSVLR